MPLKNKRGDHRGSEKDKTKSEKFCSLCYENGKFKQPNMTLEKMKEVVDKALVKEGWAKPLRWLAKRQLPKLDRWKK